MPDPRSAEDTAVPEWPASVVIQRDAFGIPSVYGRSDADTAFGLAYAHAEDDFPTIQRQLLAVRGQLGAVDGRDGAKLDYLSRFIGVQETVARGYTDQLAPETKALLRGYVAGLNSYARQHPKEVLRRSLFPVKEEDIVGGFVLVSPLFFGLDRVVGALYTNESLPPEASADERGSNAFVFAPSKTASGETILVSNSHQPWEGPAAWYETRVASAEGWRFAGALFPGSPLPLHGYNAHLGWANTINRPDLVDVYRLTLSQDRKRYLLDGAWEPLDCDRFWLRVKTGPLVLPIPQKRCRSVHGPVILNKAGAFAVRYAGMDDVRQVEQYYRLSKAGSLDEWLDAMRMRAVPATNFVYADRKGNIALLYNARLPERDRDTDWSGILPGDRRALIWTRDLPFEDQPFLLNPPSGYIVSANNTPFVATSPGGDLDPRTYETVVGIETDVTNRILRAIDLIEARGQGAKLTRADIDAVKYDKGYDPRSPLGRQILEAMAFRPQGEDLSEAASLLRSWDWTLDGEGHADALAALVIRPLNRANYRREAPPSVESNLTAAAGFLRKHHGRLDPPMTELMRLRRGSVDLPLTGGPDALRAIGWEESEDGRLVADFGDSFLLYVTWPATGGKPQGEAVSPYGAAVARPSSPHHSDQSELFATQTLRPAPLP